MAFARPWATIDYLFPRIQKSKMCDVQDLRADGTGHDGDAKKPSLFAKFESKLGDIHASLKRRKNERNCLRKTQHVASEPGQHIDAEPFITQ